MNKIELLKRIKIFENFYSIKKILFKNKKSSLLTIDNAKMVEFGDNAKK